LNQRELALAATLHPKRNRPVRNLDGSFVIQVSEPQEEMASGGLSSESPCGSQAQCCLGDLEASHVLACVKAIEKHGSLEIAHPEGNGGVFARPEHLGMPMYRCRSSHRFDPVGRTSMHSPPESATR